LMLQSRSTHPPQWRDSEDMKPNSNVRRLVRGTVVGLSSGATKLAHRSATTLTLVAHTSGVIRPQSQRAPPLLLLSSVRFQATPRRLSPRRPSPPASRCRTTLVHLLELHRPLQCRCRLCLSRHVHRLVVATGAPVPRGISPRQSGPDKAPSDLPVAGRLTYHVWPWLSLSPP
jgi:hypothetical protein